jgi:hypothetical protein
LASEFLCVCVCITGAAAAATKKRLQLLRYYTHITSSNHHFLS